MVSFGGRLIRLRKLQIRKTKGFIRLRLQKLASLLHRDTGAWGQVRMRMLFGQTHATANELEEQRRSDSGS